jgi:uncharacterized protein YprB with RNaseH-like and TPR domain
MGQNLRDRLKRIREIKTGNENRQADRAAVVEFPAGEGGAPKSAFPPEWEPSGFKVLKRTVERKLAFTVPRSFPRALAILVPDLFRLEKTPLPAELLFFDLETTGLSGGAGTGAFLAAFGRFVQAGGGFSLQVTQYLLLDYPGEPDFLDSLLPEFRGDYADSGPPLVVSYNGKSFDSQILKTRCLMNGFNPPEYSHADLLHPVRRLWKNVLPDCSQSTVETAILGLDRTGDTPGAMAPDIWFSFLRTEDPAGLTGICDHNVKDIAGLASVFLVLAEIADSPLAAAGRFNVDFEVVALKWRELLIKAPGFFGETEKKLGKDLMKSAVKQNYPRAVYVQALDLLRNDSRPEGVRLLFNLTALNCHDDIKAAALRALAVDAEWRGKDPAAALDFTESALALPGIRPGQRAELNGRKERLNKK